MKTQKTRPTGRKYTYRPLGLKVSLTPIVTVVDHYCYNDGHTMTKTVDETMKQERLELDEILSSTLVFYGDRDNDGGRVVGGAYRVQI